MEILKMRPQDLVIGQPLEGGFAGGIIRVGAKVCVFINAPKADGEFEDEEYGQYGVDIPGAASYCDGLANTDAMAAAGCEVAVKIRALRIGGKDDWQYPARDVVEINYRNLKPTTEENWCSYRDGENPSAYPALTYHYTPTSPAQTVVEAYRGDGPEAFAAALYGSSTQYSPSSASNQTFSYGFQNGNGKHFKARVRAVRLMEFDPSLL